MTRVLITDELFLFKFCANSFGKRRNPYVFLASIFSLCITTSSEEEKLRHQTSYTQPKKWPCTINLPMMLSLGIYMQLVWIQNASSPTVSIIPRQKSILSNNLFIYGRYNPWINAFLEGLSAKWYAIIPVPEWNLGRRFHSTITLLLRMPPMIFLSNINNF